MRRHQKLKELSEFGQTIKYLRGGTDKSLARPTSRYIVLLYIYINSTNIPPIMIINRIYENQNLLSLQLGSFLVGLRTYQHTLYVRTNVGCGPGNEIPLNTYISMYARTNRCYNKRRSRTNYVRYSIPNCTFLLGSLIH